jgi:hypothetical protein
MNRRLRNILVGIGAAVPLTACGSSGTPQSATAVPTSTSASVRVALPVATATPAVSSSAICGPAAVVARRMGIKDFTAYTATTDPNHLLGRQGEYTSKINWGQDRGNGNVFSSIETFPDAPDAQLRYAYLRAFRPPIGDGYDYLYRAAILRLASIYTPAQAAALKASFERACRESS